MLASHGSAASGEKLSTNEGVIVLSEIAMLGPKVRLSADGIMNDADGSAAVVRFGAVEFIPDTSGCGGAGSGADLVLLLLVAREGSIPGFLDDCEYL
jgi:hypothetical protein